MVSDFCCVVCFQKAYDRRIVAATANIGFFGKCRFSLRNVYCYICLAGRAIGRFKYYLMIIRDGRKEDMPALLALITELAVFEREPEAVVVTVSDLERDGFGENRLFHTIVAQENEQIKGMAFYYFRFSTWKGRTIHLEDLIVTENSRGTGIGLALYSEIIRRGKKANVRRIEWNVLDWNEPAIRFYEKSGAKVLSDWRVVHMDETGIDNFLNR